jgi:mannitol-1-phosphate 5-dehydrogenase
MKGHVFVGFGFGPVQSGLFVPEAFKSGNFSRIVIAEIDQKLVDTVRSNKGSYYVNIATNDGISPEKIDGIEMFNPTVDADRVELLKALSQATEIVTSLPSINFYDMGENSVASLIKQSIENTMAPAKIIYTAENNNHAAEILKEKTGAFKNVQFLNTVIGKMSQVLNDKLEIADKQLKTIAPGIDRAFLVEEFNKILVTKCNIDGFTPGIKVFFEKEDLMLFEEAKLFGHNAIHALMAYLGAFKGYTMMSQLRDDPRIMQIAEKAFIHESGAALIKKYSHFDELFTETGFRQYASDLLERMTNPYLEDMIQRAGRDPARKLGLNDRLFGAMILCIEQGIEPKTIALGAAAGIRYLTKQKQTKFKEIESILLNLWSVPNTTTIERLILLVKQADVQLSCW